MTHRIFRALLRKEWRGLRAGIIATFTGSLVTAVILRLWSSLLAEDGLRVIGAWFVNALLALGSASFATETNDETARFLEERPIPRADVWKSKVVLPLSCLLVAVPTGVILGWWSSKAFIISGGKVTKLTAEVPIFFAFVALMAVSVALFCGVLFKRGITAYTTSWILLLGLVAGPMIPMAFWYDSMRQVGKATHNLDMILSVIGIAYGLLMPTALVLLSRLIYVRQSD